MKRKITINISNEVYEYLKNEATKNYRSLSREIEYRFEKIIGYTPVSSTSSTPTTATAADSSTPASTTTSSQADTTITTEQQQPPKPKPKIRRIIGDEEDEIEFEAEQKKKEEEKRKKEEEERKKKEEEEERKKEEEKKDAPVYNDTEGTVIYEGQVYKKHPLLWLKENNIDPMDTRMDTFYRFQKVFPDVNLLEFDHYQQSRRK